MGNAPVVEEIFIEDNSLTNYGLGLILFIVCYTKVCRQLPFFYIGKSLNIQRDF